MTRKCSRKSDNGKRKVSDKKEGTWNPVDQPSEFEEVYIPTWEFESYVTAKVKETRPKTIKAHYALQGTMFINGNQLRVLFYTGTIGANPISVLFITTHEIPCSAMKERITILMAINGSRSESYKECTIVLLVDKLQTKGN